MKEEPDIVKELRNIEKIGRLQSTSQNIVLLEKDQTKKVNEIPGNDKNNIKHKHKISCSPQEIFIRKSEEIQELLFQITSDLMAYIDTHGRIIKANRQYLIFSGFSEEEIIGKKFWEVSGLLEKESVSSAYNLLKDILLGKDINNFTMSFYDKNQRKYKINVSTFLIEEKNKLKYILVVGRNITNRKKTEEALAESENQYRTLFERANDMIQSVDNKGHFLLVNPEWKKIMGYSDKEISKLVLTDIIHNDSLPHCVEIFSRVLGGDKMENIEAKFVTKMDEVILVEGKISACYLNGKIIGTQGIFRDNTKRKLAEDALRKSEKRFRDLAELLPEIIFEADFQGRLTYLNQKAFEVFGYKSDDLHNGLTIPMLIAPEYLKKQKNDYSKILFGHLSSGHEYVFLKKDGTRIPMMVFSVPIFDEENIIGARGVAVDLTELKKAYNEIEDLLKMKNDFINQLGHDLKTPLSPLINLLPLVREKEQDPKSKERLDVSISCVNYMRDLVVKTIELAKLSSDKIPFDIHDIDLQKSIKIIIEQNKHLFLEKNITIENNITDTCMVKADFLQLEEILNNIVSNAMRYMPEENGKITFNAAKKQNQVIISIKDTGVGLVKDQLELIFDEFYKCDTSRHNLNSTGLGLSICKRIVEKHGGRIWAESPGIRKGATFFFTLPAGEIKK